MSSEAKLYEQAYNAHEWAEDAALTAMYEKLREQSLDALMCLADPEWRWETRSTLSVYIQDAASEILNEKLDALVAA